METVACDVGSLQCLGQFMGEEHITELAVGVGPE